MAEVRVLIGPLVSSYLHLMFLRLCLGEVDPKGQCAQTKCWIQMFPVVSELPTE